MSTITDTDRRPSRLARVAGSVAIRLALLGAALLVLRLGAVRAHDWALSLRGPSFGEGLTETAPEWTGWLLVMVGAGLLFGLAARLPRRPAYRIGSPLVLAAILALMLAHPVLLYGLEVSLPGPLDRAWFYMNSDVQFALAVMLGVALAAGFDAQPAQPGRTSPDS